MVGLVFARHNPLIKVKINRQKHDYARRVAAPCQSLGCDPDITDLAGLNGVLNMQVARRRTGHIPR